MADYGATEIPLTIPARAEASERPRTHNSRKALGVTCVVACALLLVASQSSHSPFVTRSVALGANTDDHGAAGVADDAGPGANGDDDAAVDQGSGADSASDDDGKYGTTGTANGDPGKKAGDNDGKGHGGLKECSKLQMEGACTHYDYCSWNSKTSACEGEPKVTKIHECTDGSCRQSGVGNGGGQDCNELDEHHCIKSSICYYDTDMLSCEPNDEKEGSPTKHSTAGTKDCRMGFNCTTSVNGTNTTTVVSSNTTTTTVVANSTNTTR